MKLGQFVTRPIAHPTVGPDAGPGITLLVDLDADVDPDEALIHVGRVIQQVQDLDPELKLQYASSLITDRHHIAIYLRSGLTDGAVERLEHLAKSILQKPVFAKPARLMVAKTSGETMGGAKL